MATAPGEITEDQWAVLKTLYSSPDDIDLYAAGQVITDTSEEEGPHGKQQKSYLILQNLYLFLSISFI